jgi:hypothetical protein
LIVEHRVEQILCDLFQFSVELGEFFLFLCHAYRVAQPRKNARDFLRLKKLFFMLDKQLGMASA